MLTVSINTLLPYKPCKEGWVNFLNTFNNPDPERQFTIPELLDAGIPVPDVIWSLRALPESTLSLIQSFTLGCAESVLPVFEDSFPDDNRPRVALETAKAFLRGEATRDALLTAAADAYAAADAAADAAHANAAAYANAAAAAYAAHANAAANAAAAVAAYAANANAAANAAAAVTAYAANANAAAAAYAADGAAYATYATAKERQKQAELLRKYFS